MLTTSNALFKKLGGAGKGYNLVEGAHLLDSEGRARPHRWVRDDQGIIYDASRDQFGDKTTIHKIKPKDPRYNKYMEDNLIDSGDVMEDHSNKNTGNTPLEKLTNTEYGNLWEQNEKRKARWLGQYNQLRDRSKINKVNRLKTKGMKAIFGKSARIQMARERLGAVGKIDWSKIISKQVKPKSYIPSEGAGFLSSKGEYFGLKNPKNQNHERALQDILESTGDKSLMEKYDPHFINEGDNSYQSLAPWLKDSGMMRLRHTVGETGLRNLISLESNSTPTSAQIRSLKTYIKDYDIDTERILVDDYTNSGLASTLSGRSRFNAKLRQRIAGLGFRERILNWLREQPRFKSFDPDSSFVGTVKYDQDNQSMQIELNGKKYDFCNVEERLFDSFSGAGSKGAFFNREIKSLHNCGAW